MTVFRIQYYKIIIDLKEQLTEWLKHFNEVSKKYNRRGLYMKNIHFDCVVEEPKSTQPEVFYEWI